jgi:hypothetical protein
VSKLAWIQFGIGAAVIVVVIAAYVADRAVKRKYLGIEALEKRVEALEKKP